MRNIFNNLGYTTKHTLVGVALGMATIAIGVGVVSNLGSSPQRAGGAALDALEQYQEPLTSAAATGGEAQYTREELEQTLAQAQKERENPSVYQLKNIPSKDRLGYNNLPDVNLKENDAANPAGGLEGLAPGGINAAEVLGSKGAAASGSEGSSGSDAALADASVAGAGQKLTAMTQKAELQTGPRIGNTGGGKMAGGAMSGGSTASRAAATADTSYKNISQDKAKGLDTGTSFKGGRAGSLGGYNVAAGQGVNDTKGGQQFFTVGELENAALKSRKAAGSVSKESAKAVALAQAAFDGSQEAEGGISVSENGGVNTQSVSNSLQRTAGKLSSSPSGTWTATDPEELRSKEESEWKAIKKKIIWKMVLMGAIALVVSAMTLIPGLGLGTLLISAAAMAGIYACMKGLGHKGTSIEDLINKAKDLQHVNVNTDKWMNAARTVYWISTALVTPIIALPLVAGLYLASRKNKIKFLKNLSKSTGDKKASDEASKVVSGGSSDSTGSSLTDSNLTSATKEIDTTVK